MDTIRLHDTGAAVEDVQRRLATAGFLDEAEVTGTFDDRTQQALRAFARHFRLPATDMVDDKTWATLVDASFNMGDRTLYLRMPYFHGHDVLQLQKALGALGFTSGASDGIFGAHTELALRKFQVNLGLPSDGIAGAYTYAALRNLQHSWEGKEAAHLPRPVGFARAADVLEQNALCLFGIDEFTRSVASRMSNLSQATNPRSKIVSADALSVPPDDSMLLVHVVLPHTISDADDAPRLFAAVPRVVYGDEETLSLQLRNAIGAMKAPRAPKPPRIIIELPGDTWEDAGANRSAQHFAITLLDALCSALFE